MSAPGVDAFEKLAARLNYPMFVVTTAADAVSAGCLVGFAGQPGDEMDKFRRCSWRRGPADLPILDDAAAWFAGEILDRFSLGDHVGHRLEPVAGNPPHDLERWVSFGNVRDLQPGREA